METVIASLDALIARARLELETLEEARDKLAGDAERVSLLRYEAQPQEVRGRNPIVSAMPPLARGDTDRMTGRQPAPKTTDDDVVAERQQAFLELLNSNGSVSRGAAMDIWDGKRNTMLRDIRQLSERQGGRAIVLFDDQFRYGDHP